MTDQGSAPEGKRNNGKLSIPLPFDEALKAAMKVPADKLTTPNGKTRKATKKKQTKS